MNNDDRRKFPRVTVNIPVEVEGYYCEQGGFQEVSETFNLSPLGASFHLLQPVEVDDILLLSLHRSVGYKCKKMAEILQAEKNARASKSGKACMRRNSSQPKVVAETQFRPAT